MIGCVFRDYVVIYLYRSHADLNVASFIASRNFFVPFPLFGLNATSFIADLISQVYVDNIYCMTKTISIRGEVKFKLIIYAMAVKSRRRFAI